MSKCQKCNQEFTQEDKEAGNFRQYMGDLYHRLCPDTYHKCHVCGEDISDGSEVKTALGHRHNGCVKRLKSEDTQPDPRSWIVR